MGYSNWNMLGEEIRHTVQNAVDTRNFRSLNQSVKNSFDRTFSRDIPPLLFKNVQWVRIWSVLMTAAGGALALSIAPLLLPSLLAAALFPGPVKIFSAAFMTILFGAGAGLAGTGIARLLMLKRFKIYIEELGTRGYFEIKNLSARLAKPQRYIVRDIKSLIRRRYFLEGHLDRQEICFMASDDVYGQYCRLMEHVEAQRIRENEEKEEQKRIQEKKDGLDPKVRAVIETGDGYIRKIRDCNDRIPGEEISAKISKIENLVDRIFDRVEEDPSCIPDISKLMEYYLPTTVKLLDAYAELDLQPVQGENIISAKKEIEDTLDTLNIAFTKLLDSLFREKAWDVSSDISVLNTVLAREGLTKKDFDK